MCLKLNEVFAKPDVREVDVFGYSILKSFRTNGVNYVEYTLLGVFGQHPLHSIVAQECDV
jgi:hypothetical protein